VLTTTHRGVGRLEVRGDSVIAGLGYAGAVARQAGCPVRWSVSEGSSASKQSLGELEGDLAAILRAERPVLNLLQRACGIASATREYVDAVAGTGCRVLHTRKTAPGLRLFDAAAVVAGGGAVHRLDLSRTLMIKDNHWRALAREGRTITQALEQARRRGATSLQVEVESQEQVEAAAAAGADRLLVDNQDPATVRRWGQLARRSHPRILIEATGGITLSTVKAFAEAGADFVSVGALTHSVRAADIALTLETRTAS
jgi:nicotinate-nucleotide pyrophosphorylase (carboxylating)